MMITVTEQSGTVLKKCHPEHVGWENRVFSGESGAHDYELWTTWLANQRGGHGGVTGGSTNLNHQPQPPINHNGVGARAHPNEVPSPVSMMNFGRVHNVWKLKCMLCR